MEIKTVLYIILAAVIALLVSAFQYFYKKQINAKLSLLLSCLRFSSVFGILMLIINPQFSKISYTLEKPNLIVLTDNSTSISKYDTEVEQLVANFKTNKSFKERFNISAYSFGKNMNTNDSLDFKDKYTNIQKALATLENVYDREETAIVLLSDGNQTIGQDYAFLNTNDKTKIYPVVIGDTTKYKDIAVGPIVINKYAFLKNKFPLESYITYQGDGNEKTSIVVSLNGKTVYHETVLFNSEMNYKTIQTEIEATSVGLKNISIKATALKGEQNTDNNRRASTIEVIDEKTNIAIISQITHPDLGAVKKAIESNEQREVFIHKPNVSLDKLKDIDLFIFYQPDLSFKTSIEFVKKKNTNSLTITGTHTDYNFLNSVQKAFKIEDGYPVQEVFGILNKGFTKYDVSEFEMLDFPPLQSNAGALSFNTNYESQLGTQIKGLDIDKPLLAVYLENSRKQALFLGEDIWKWRIQTFRNNGEFKNFDVYIGNMIRYLTSNKSKSRLNVNYENRYEGSANVVLTATYFDEAFLFDPNAKISITVTNKETKMEATNPMVLKKDYFETDLSHLPAGEYSFKVTVDKQSFSKSGNFAITEFDLENQFVTSDIEKLSQLATNGGGAVYFPSEWKKLEQELLKNDAFVPTEKSTENIVSLIDFRILLGLIALAFALEWFIRKYNGLI